MFPTTSAPSTAGIALPVPAAVVVVAASPAAAITAAAFTGVRS